MYLDADISAFMSVPYMAVRDGHINAVVSLILILSDI